MKHNQRGFSIVELMVGILISLLVILTIISTFQVILSQKKITIGNNNVIDNLSYTYRELADSIKMSGYGVNECSSVNFKQASDEIYTPEGSNTGTTKNFNIIKDLSGSDIIMSTYGVSDTGIAYTSIDSIENTTTLAPKYIYSFLNKNLMLGFSNSSDYSSCTLSAISGVTGSSITIVDTFKGNTLKSENIPQNSKLRGFSDFKNLKYSIDSDPKKDIHNLIVVDTIAKTTTVLAKDIVAMRAYFGTNTTTNTPNNTTIATTIFKPANSDIDTKEIISVRVILIARSNVKNSKINGVCNTTNIEPVSSVDNTPITISNNTDWQCYRYKQLDAIIPLKNLNKV